MRFVIVTSSPLYSASRQPSDVQMSKSGSNSIVDAEIEAASFPYKPSPAFPTSILDGEAQRAKSHGKRIGILIVTYITQR